VKYGKYLVILRLREISEISNRTNIVLRNKEKSYNQRESLKKHREGLISKEKQITSQ